MKVLLGILLAIGAVNVAESWDEGLRVKFNVGLFPSTGEDYFFNVPRTIAAAVQEGWTRTKRPKGPLSQLKMYCPTDKILCALYDDLEDICGLQTALPKCKFNNYYDWETRGFTKWNTAIDGQCRTFYTIQQYFVSEEYLAKSKSERRALRDAGAKRVLKENAVWVTGFNKELVKVANSVPEIESAGFTEQACIPWMGKHYYYNMTTELTCSAETIFPWFPLTVDGELVGTGFMTAGTLPIEEDQRDWFERPPRSAVSLIVPRGPECLYDLSDAPGILTMHIYYIDNPWSIFFCG